MKFKTVHQNKQELNQFFEDSDLSVRALNSIKQSRIETPEELFKLSNQELLSLKFGKKTINEVTELRDKYLKTLPQTSYFYISEQEKDFNIGTVEERVEWLPRFTPLSDGIMLEDIDGEYVLVSSVLNLFSSQK